MLVNTVISFLAKLFLLRRLRGRACERVLEDVFLTAGAAWDAAVLRCVRCEEDAEWGADDLLCCDPAERDAEAEGVLPDALCALDALFVPPLRAREISIDREFCRLFKFLFLR